MVTASTQPIWLKVASVTGRAPASGSDDPKLKPKSKPKPWNPTIGCGALPPKPKPKKLKTESLFKSHLRLAQ